MEWHTAQSRSGFTLLEVLIALVLFTLITAIIYATFSTVVNSTEMARVDIERLRMQEYLVRSFTTNLSTVYSDVLMEDANFDLVGIDFEDEDGAADSLTFASTAPLIGGFSLPGDIKLVTYEIPIEDDEMFLSEDKPRPTPRIDPETGEESTEPLPLEGERQMVISESPLITGNTQSLNSDSDDEDDPMFENDRDADENNRERDGFSGSSGDRDPQREADVQARQAEAERRREERNRPRPSDLMDEDDDEYKEPITNQAMFQRPYMELAVRTLDIEYFDGEEWVPEWNSSAYESTDEDTPEALGRLPWAVRLRINFAKSEEELAYDKQDGLNEEEDVDFEMVVPVRQGQGITQHVYEVPELQNLVPGYAGGAPVPDGVAIGEDPPGEKPGEKPGNSGNGGGARE